MRQVKIMTSIASLLIMALMVCPTRLRAADYQVQKDQSIVSFSGKHVGNDFSGQFETWDAVIHFDADDLPGSSVTVTFVMADAKTGNAMYDGTLPTLDWFDVDHYPTAKFSSTSFKKTDSGYSVTGDLTIKNITKSMTFDFGLNGDHPIHMTAQFPISRLDYNIGMESDPKSEWVSSDIIVTLDLTAE